MKIYSYDRGVYGMTVVVANSREEAYKLFCNEQYSGYAPNTIDSFSEHEIEVGLVIDNLGDA